jgi:hypothetical protein
MVFSLDLDQQEAVEPDFATARRGVELEGQAFRFGEIDPRLRQVDALEQQGREVG